MTSVSLMDVICVRWETLGQLFVHLGVLLMKAFENYSSREAVHITNSLMLKNRNCLRINAYYLPLQGLEMTYRGTSTSKYEYTRQTKATWCKFYGILVWGFFLS